MINRCHLVMPEIPTVTNSRYRHHLTLKSLSRRKLSGQIYPVLSICPALIHADKRLTVPIMICQAHQAHRFLCALAPLVHPNLLIYYPKQRPHPPICNPGQPHSCLSRNRRHCSHAVPARPIRNVPTVDQCNRHPHRSAWPVVPFSQPLRPRQFAAAAVEHRRLPISPFALAVDAS